MPIRVKTPGGIVEFPDGTDPSVMERALREQFTPEQEAPIAPVASHAAPEPPADSPYAEVAPDYAGAAREIGATAKRNAPMIGAGMAVAAGPGGVLPALALAGGGGYLGARVRGDDRPSASIEGVKQAALEGGGRLAGGALRLIGKATMRGTIPKNIAKEYDSVDIAQEALDRNVVPGSSLSANRVRRLSTAANAERDAAAATVPVMPRRKIISGIKPVYQEAATAKEPEIAEDLLAYMRKSARDIGPEGLTGEQQLARKTIKQRQGKAALGGNAREASTLPQATNAERGAIASHLRETPRMATALDESQALMALDDVMKDAAHSNPITRARIGGLTSAAMTPIGLGLTGHAFNKGARALDPQVLRALALMAQLRGEEPNQ